MATRGSLERLREHAVQIVQRVRTERAAEQAHTGQGTNDDDDRLLEEHTALMEQAATSK